MNAMLVAAAIWMGSGSSPGGSAGESWSSESERSRHLGRAEARVIATTLGGESQPASLYWESRRGNNVPNTAVLMRSLGRAEAWYLGDMAGTVDNTDLSVGVGEMRRLCAQAEENPKSC